MHISLDSALGRQRRLNQIGETITSIAAPTAAYSLRSLTGGDPLAVRVRRSSNDALAEKDFTVSGITSGALLNHINEDVITEQSDFTSGVDGYAKDSHGSVAREATYEGKSDVLNYAHNGGRFAFKKTTVALERTSSYTITFEYYADTAFNNQSWGVERSFPTGGRPTISSNSPTVVSDAWTSVTLNVPSGRTTGTQILSLRIENHSSTSDYGTTTNGSVRIKNIVVTQTTGSGFVTTWYDQSGNNNNLTQTDTDKQPAIATNGSLVTTSSKPALKFDGTDDLLEKETFTQGTLSQPNTFFAVAKLDSNDDTNRKIFDSHDSTARNMLFLSPTNAGEFAFFATSVVTTGETADANNNLFTALYNGTSSVLRVNAVQKAASNVGTMSMIGLIIGESHNKNSNIWKGTIQEIIVYNSNQTSQFTSLETNIKNNYSIS